MTPVPITEKLLAGAAGWDVMKAARALQRAGRISDATYDAPLLTGYAREGSRTLRAGLRIKSASDVENLCTCREARAWGKICEHSVAVGLQWLSPPVAPPPVSAGTSASGASTAVTGPQFVPLGTAGSEPVTLHIILPPALLPAWEKDRLMVVVEAAAGDRRVVISALDSARLYGCDEHDLAAAEAFTAAPALLQSGMATLSRAELLRMLHSLVRHPRVTFGKSTAVQIPAAPIRLPLRVTRSGPDALKVETAPPADAHLLVTKEDAWVLRKQELARCAAAMSPETLQWLDVSRTLEDERASRFLALDLPRLRDVFDISLGDGIAVPRITPAQPAIELELTGTLRQLDARLYARYGERPRMPLPAADNEIFVLRTPEHPSELCVRNIAAEESAVRTLSRSGFSPAEKLGVMSLRGEAAVARFFGSEYPRLEQIWSVNLAAPVRKWSGEIERVTPRMEIVASGEDWFEMRYSLAASGGQEFSSAEIQRLLRGGQAQTRLRDGRTAVVDTDSLEDFEQVLRDIDPRQTQPGVYRIDRRHAAFLEETARENGAVMLDHRASLRRFLLDEERLPELGAGALWQQLRDYQKEGVRWLARLAAHDMGGILADEMGLGKTLQTLAFLNARRQPGKPALVVCPTSLVANWLAEARRFTPELRTLALTGTGRAELFPKVPENDLVITTYALLRRDIEPLRGWEFSCAVLDEAQQIRNPETQNAQAACALRARHRFVLTGTPMENSVRDLWSIMQFAMPGYLGSRSDFRERYEQPLARGAAPDLLRRLTRRLRPVLLRRRKIDVAQELPEKIEQVLTCELTDEQRGAYDALLREIQQGLASSGPGEPDKARRMKMLTGLLRLRQICCDLRLLGMDGEAGASAKLELLDELLDEAISGGHRVLLFSQFVSMLHLIRTRIEKQAIPFSYLDGQTADRQAAVEQFQTRDDIPVFLISLKAGGVGLNLSAADTVIHFDPWWNPAVEAQATDRAHRIGQKRVVTAYKLIAAGTVEEKIVRLQEKKRAMIDAAIDSEQPLMSGLTTAEIEELLR